MKDLKRFQLSAARFLKLERIPFSRRAPGRDDLEKSANFCHSGLFEREKILPRFRTHGAFRRFSGDHSQGHCLALRPEQDPSPPRRCGLFRGMRSGRQNDGPFLHLPGPHRPQPETETENLTDGGRGNFRWRHCFPRFLHHRLFPRRIPI